MTVAFEFTKLLIQLISEYFPGNLSMHVTQRSLTVMIKPHLLITITCKGDDYQGFLLYKYSYSQIQWPRQLLQIYYIQIVANCPYLTVCNIHQQGQFFYILLLICFAHYFQLLLVYLHPLCYLEVSEAYSSVELQFFCIEKCRFVPLLKCTSKMIFELVN